MRRRAWLPLVMLVPLAACGRETAERSRHEAERRALEATLDRLEERLLVNQGRVQLWDELGARHESVSAIACASQEGHAEEMARRLLPRERHRAAAEPAEPARIASASRATRSAGGSSPPFRRLAAAAGN
jgi:hypothetical protein